jgi:hypothetical protein
MVASRRAGNIQQQGMADAGSVVVQQSAQIAEQGATRQAAPEQAQPAQVTVCGSGNLGVVYFDLFPRKVTRNELNTAYPGLFDAVVAHEGVGFVVAYEEDGTPVVHGRRAPQPVHGEVEAWTHWK